MGALVQHKKHEEKRNKCKIILNKCEKMMNKCEIAINIQASQEILRTEGYIRNNTKQNKNTINDDT
jgi:hypothetical protein